MKRILALALGLVMSACSGQTYTQSSTKEERDVALNQVLACFNWATPLHDDGVSPARLIAETIAHGACQTETRNFAAVYNAGIPDSISGLARAQMIDGEFFVDIILMDRAKRLNSKPPK